MSKIKLGIFGPTGRMGTSLLEESKNFSELEICSLCESLNHEDIGKEIFNIKIIDNLEEFISLSEVIIDFTTPEATLNLMKKIRNKKDVSLITGTTGFSDDQEKHFIKLSKNLRILKSSNMSIGVNLLMACTEFLSSKFEKEVDIEIVEAHHRNKSDSPSGTALSIGESIKKGRKQIENNKFIFRSFDFNKKREKGEIGFSSIRGGDIIGEHKVFFISEGERIEICHKAERREIFSRGALKCVKWIVNQRPGLYNLQDMLTSGI